jgi:hypothetical protein
MPQCRSTQRVHEHISWVTLGSSRHRMPEGRRRERWESAQSASLGEGGEVSELRAQLGSAFGDDADITIDVFGYPEKYH